jgi:hypothetical protein
MNPSSDPRSGDRANSAVRRETDSGDAKTPNPDMQPEDTGTADSGNDKGQGPAATRSMKQTSKTPAESGDKR